MATWNLESVGAKGYGGGGSYFCARAAKAIIKKKKENRDSQIDKTSIFTDPLFDTVYGQCSSGARREGMKDDIAELVQPTELEQALAVARAAVSNHEHRNGSDGGSRSRGLDYMEREDVQVIFEEPFKSKNSRKSSSGIPLTCLGTGEHAVYVLRVTYNGRQWHVERRYSEFDELDKDIYRTFGSDSSIQLIALPAKVSETWRVCPGPLA